MVCKGQTQTVKFPKNSYTFLKQFSDAWIAYSSYNVDRLMNRQELFHVEPHLESVSRADRGYRGASIFISPFFTSRLGSTGTRDTFYLIRTYDSIKNN
jgi:hypothetical protein